MDDKHNEPPEQEFAAEEIKKYTFEPKFRGEFPISDDLDAAKKKVQELPRGFLAGHANTDEEVEYMHDDFLFGNPPPE
jgi:hypothetical protein